MPEKDLINIIDGLFDMIQEHEKAIAELQEIVEKSREDIITLAQVSHLL